MTSKEFEKIFRHRIQHLDMTLIQKAKGYAFNNDRLHNFKMSAGITRDTPVQTAWSFMAKHLTSIKDMVDGHYVPTPENLDEKITDAIAYLILIEACLKETFPAHGGKPVE